MILQQFLRLLLVFATLLAAASAAYEYTSQRLRNSGYVGAPDSSAWVYPGDNNDNYAQRQLTNGGNRYASSQYQYPRASNRVSRVERRNYDNSNQRGYYPSLNELDAPRTYSRNRWNSNLKRQAPSSRLAMDKHNRVQMGVSNSLCDDAKTNLTVDWNLSPINYTCFHPETRFPRSFDAEPLFECESLPPRYVPGHVCMDQDIPYKDSIPTHGDHRPLWPKFGEYMFVPRERWLHNIEHGAVVMLYHPCAYPSEVARLRTIVRSCVGKHVITPSTYLSPERPLALVAWGCRLQMSSVDDELAMNFIKTRAHRGPEGTYTKEGQYELGLIKSAKRTGNGAKYGYSKVTCDTLDRSRL